MTTVPTWTDAEPLWKRAPTRDSEGRPLSDFMMFIPGLSRRPDQYIKGVVAHIEAVLGRYQDVVVFADLNLRLNVLWVTIRPVAGMCLEIPGAIQTHVPEALLVAQRQVW